VPHRFSRGLLGTGVRSTNGPVFGLLALSGRRAQWQVGEISPTK